MRREKAPGLFAPGLFVYYQANSVIEPQRHACGARLVRQKADARPLPALAVQRQVRSLVRQVIDEQRDFPTRASHADPRIREAVARQQRIERERVLGEWAADGI